MIQGKVVHKGMLLTMEHPRERFRTSQFSPKPPGVSRADPWSQGRGRWKMIAKNGLRLSPFMIRLLIETSRWGIPAFVYDDS